MRIVGGIARGRRLAAPASATRPTSDRAREGLFNTVAALGVELDGARVLDLFAGTGAVGLEALSRGAREAVFVESDRAAAAVLRRNVETVGLPGAVVHVATAAAVLRERSSETFDLVFADPPYALPDAELRDLLAAAVVNGWSGTDGSVVVERARGSAPPWPVEITSERERRYGDTALWYGRPR